ncbi:MAG TPA: prephenate dehydratase [Clostridia bacterium]|nr:prephenate dehydratase [Clostridia bacterium]
MGELGILRQKLNEVDEKLVGLFIERMELVTKVGEYKAEKNLKVYDPVREKEIIERFANGVKVDFDIKYVEQFLENLMFLSRKAQVDIIGRKKEPIKFESPNAAITIGYQGMPGCYSQQTGLEYFGEEIGTVSCHSFRDVFEALAKGTVQYGILPIENSTSGSINDVYDLLREYEFYIIGEKCLNVEHCLLAVEGADLADIREVYSHQQGLIQCSRYLSERPEWKQVPYFDTAGSAEYVAKEGLKSKACIAGDKAASVYGLSVISQNIQDNRNNSTRFVIISKEMLEDEKADKISVVLSVPHRPGTLYGILRHFAKGNCNLMKIESRPLEGKAWEYFFYIDFSGNVNEESTRSILADIEKESSFFRLLGNYRSEDGCRL